MTLPFALGTLRVATPAALALLTFLPLFFLGTRRGRTRRAAAVRALAAAAVVLAIAGLALERSAPESGTCVIAAIDVSASVDRAAVTSAESFLGRLLDRLGPHDLVGSVAFGSRARVLARPEGARRDPFALLPPLDDDVSGLERSDTDLAGALAAAAPLCPEGKQTALVLFTDGNETVGSALAEATLLEPRFPVFAVVPRAAELPAAVVRRVLVPSFAPEHTVLPLEVVVETRGDAPLPATLTLRANGDVVGREALDLAPGVSVVALPYRLRGAGHYLLETTLDVPPGVPPPVGGMRAALTVTRPLRVISVSERPAPVVASALAERGMRVEMVSPAGFEERSRALADTHVVVLDDVARAGFSDESLARLAAWVAAGGGLVVTGGEHLFGDPAWVGSPLERELPVRLRSQTPDPQEREPIALYLIIDRSNSMGYASGQPTVHNGEKMTYAKRAALAVLDQLGDRDLVGAIAFDSQPYELGPLAPAGETRGSLGTRIQQIQYGGGTDFKDALDIARRNLLDSGRSVRHIILLTDGDTNRGAEDHAALIAALAQGSITVTAIRIGSDTVNLDLLAAISKATGGEFHHVASVEALPQLLIRDAQRLIKNAPERRTVAARMGAPGSILAGLQEPDLPPLGRWALARGRAGADLRLWVEVGEDRDPLLATWQYELGHVAVLPLDFQGGAAQWAAWDGFAKLWTQLVLWAAPPGLATDHHLAVERVRDGTRIQLDTVADDAGPFVMRIPSVGEVQLRQTGRRSFAATVPSLRAGLQPVVLVGGGVHDERVELMVPATAEGGHEQRALEPDRRLLERLASATGGSVDPDPAEVLSARPGVRRETVPLDVWLIPLALGLILVDVALRRA